MNREVEANNIKLVEVESNKRQLVDATITKRSVEDHGMSEKKRKQIETQMEQNYTRPEWCWRANTSLPNENIKLKLHDVAESSCSSNLNYAYSFRKP